MAIQIIPNYRKPFKGILQEPDPRLRKISKIVTAFNNHTHRIAGELVNLLKEIDKPFLPWLGMAAPQIGYNERIIAIKRGYHNYLVMINPEVIQQKFLLPTISGCFSLPGLYITKAHFYFFIKYKDLNGNYHKDRFWGAQSILLQQELDHLRGKLVCD